MSALLDVFGYLAVILRGLSLSLECLLLGGSAYLFWVRRFPPLHFPRKLLAGVALALIFVDGFWLSVNSALLQSTTGITWLEAFRADFFLAGLLQITGALCLLMLSARGAPKLPAASLAACSLVLLGSVLTSHSAARLEHRGILMAITGGHQLGAALWIGGLPFFLWSMAHLAESGDRVRVAKGYTRQAITGVSLLLCSGLVLGLFYIRSPQLVYGTAYGVMTATKIALLVSLLAFGWKNNQLIWRKLTEGRWRWRLRRFTEAEIGIGFTTILAAASLTSQPPAIDMQASRVAASIIIARFTPRVPSMRTPALAELSPPTPLNAAEERAFHSSPLDTFVPGVAGNKPDKPSDIAWSEYNHNWAGLIVLTAGLLALLSRFRWGSWARHWPLVFIGLAVFLLLRADSENWPLGPRGFWESFAVAEVAQHRLFVLLIVLFAVFEWSVQTHRVRAQRAALVFPAVCILGGTLLLAHNHSLSKVQEELLAELSHTPIALLGLVAGWARWLEIRFPETPPRWAVNAWPVCFIAIGYLLLTYREH
jgi:copper resistance protein D